MLILFFVRHFVSADKGTNFFLHMQIICIVFVVGFVYRFVYIANVYGYGFFSSAS